MSPFVHIAVEIGRRINLELTIEPAVRLAAPTLQTYYAAEHRPADATVLRMIHGDSKDYWTLSAPYVQSIDGARHLNADDS
jgi:hypothetical protein